MKKLLISVLLILSAFCVYAQNIDPELLKRAEAGDAEAQHRLGMMYTEMKNYEQSVYWFKKASDNGSVNAAVNLGSIYSNGSLPVNMEESIKYYTIAAEAGNALAQYNLGVIYYNGYGTPKNSDLAEYWYTMSATRNHKPAQEALGKFYLSEYGNYKSNNGHIVGCAWAFISGTSELSSLCQKNLSHSERQQAYAESKRLIDLYNLR